MLLNEMEIFYYVVELQSFSKAASRLKVSKSFISKKIDKLERDLKVNLISRSTRKLTITEAGNSFYQYCVQIVHQGHEAYSMISELKGKPSGKLKISMPPALGLNLMTPMLSKFLLHYPDVSLDIELESKVVDIVEEGYDLVLRSAILGSSNLIAQKVFSIKSVICATEFYLKSHPELIIASDLEKHNCAVYSYTKKASHITLIKNDHEEMIHIKGNLISNQLDLIKHMVLDHVCIAVLPEFMVKKEIQDNIIKICLSDYRLRESPLYAIYPQRNFMLPKLKSFLEMLKTYL